MLGPSISHPVSFMRTIVNSPSRERSPHSAEAVMSFFYPRSGRRRPSHNVIRTRVFDLHSALRGAERVTHSPGTGHRCFRQRRFTLVQRAIDTSSAETVCNRRSDESLRGLDGRHLLDELLICFGERHVFALGMLQERHHRDGKSANYPPF